ncbi:Conserved_hypothetical protein [Hexamita inflata]|uniref:Myb-like DNA-binding domain-containing protein n=1 Tax=Hexamita inflata TaxID=28002 RepID=A0AA86RFI5_9EUKA|nr:Conserved hypothetical protein [Hexamita inflata]
MDNTNQITYHKWTDEELAKVQRGITEYGHRWRLIQQNLLPHMPIQTIKNKFYSIEYKKDDTTKKQAKKKIILQPNNNIEQFYKNKQVQMRSQITPSVSVQNSIQNEQQEIIKKLGDLLGMQI